MKIKNKIKQNPQNPQNPYTITHNYNKNRDFYSLSEEYKANNNSKTMFVRAEYFADDESDMRHLQNRLNLLKVLTNIIKAFDDIVITNEDIIELSKSLGSEYSLDYFKSESFICPKNGEEKQRLMRLDNFSLDYCNKTYQLFRLDWVFTRNMSKREKKLNERLN